MAFKVIDDGQFSTIEPTGDEVNNLDVFAQYSAAKKTLLARLRYQRNNLTDAIRRITATSYHDLS